MPTLNRAQIIGYLGRDPEVRYTSTGKPYTTFSVAVSRRWKDRDGNAKEDTDWFNIEAWGKLGEICQQYLSKGRLVYLEGPLRTDRYEHDGQTRYFTKIIVRQMQILDRRSDEEEHLENVVLEEEA